MSEPETGEDERPFSAVPKTDTEDTAFASAASKPRRAWFDLPDGAVGIFLLLLLAAGCGGLIAIYWPWLAGGSGDNPAIADRLNTLETRVGQIASGHASEVAAASFEDLKRSLATLKDRVSADEARLTDLEKSSGVATGTDLAVLKAALDKNTSDIAQLNQKIGDLKQPAQGAAAIAQVAANEKAITALRSEFDTRAQATGDALGKLGARVADVEKNAPPADLPQRLDSFALKSGVAELQTRVAHLESQDTAGLVRRAASALALADLVRTSEGHEPFANELDALRALMPASQEVADLSKYAQQGVPTVPMLAARFHQDIDSILAAERASQARNWVQRVWADIVDLVSVRRIGNVPGNETQARVARAEFALKNGDLAAAVNDIQGLDTAAKAAAAPWLADAEARLAVNRDARALTNRIVSTLVNAQMEAKVPPQTDAGQ